MAERAHIVAHSDDGPRADPSMTADARANVANIVLLCPTCHTIIDRDPNGHPVDDLLARKRARAEAVALVGGTPIFADRLLARRAAMRLLERNRLLFEQKGPHPDDGSTASAEAADAWKRCVLEEIVPNSRLLLAIVELNQELTTTEDRSAAEELRQHVDAQEQKHLNGVTVGFVPRFPLAAQSLFEDV